MLKSIYLFLFPLAFIIFVPLSVGFALQKDQLHKPVNTTANTADSDEELSMLEEDTEQLKNKYENRENEIDPGIVLSNPDVLNKVDPGIFLGDPEESMIEIDPDIVK